MNSITRVLKRSASICALLAGIAHGQVYELTEQSWDNPEFRARFLESYLGQSEVNPKISPEEKALFDEIVPLISSSPNEAVEKLQTALGPESSAAFDFILGNLLYQEGDALKAAEAYEKAIKKFSNYFMAYYNAGRAYVAEGQYASALAHLQDALEIQSGDGSLYGLIGYCYINLDRPATALDAYRVAVMLAPESRDWKLGKLQCHVALEQREDAIGLLYEFIEDEPDNADWWKLQANQFLALGDVGKAAANLTVVRDMGKADGASLSLLGDLLLNEGLVQAAMESYFLALDRKQARVGRVFEVANSLIMLGEMDQAEGFVAKVDQTIGGDFSGEEAIEFLNIKARLAMETDDVETAAEFLEQIVTRDPMNGYALLTLSDLERSRGDLAKAVFFAENASKVQEFEHQACLTLAQLKVGQKDYREAAKHLRRAQQIQPKDYVADYLLKIEQAALRM